MKILILGHKGMLGRTAEKYFSDKNEVIAVEERFSVSNKKYFLSEIQKKSPDIIINCLGKIKQKNPDSYSLYEANSYMPQFMAESISKDQIFVHPSTDCVFSGLNKTGSYKISDDPDPVDDYGLSKLQSERISQYSNCLVIRTSVIGLEEHSNFGLLSWFLGSEGEVQGFSNHIWSGITTLEWCKSVEKMISCNMHGLHHISSTPITKLNLLKLFKEVYNSRTEIKESISIDSINRSLDDSSIVVRNIDEQLKDMKNFWRRREDV